MSAPNIFQLQPTWASCCPGHVSVLSQLSPKTVCMCVQDKINAFWEISKKELEDTRAQLRNKDREMEELEERHQIEIKVWYLKPDFICTLVWCSFMLT